MTRTSRASRAFTLAEVILVTTLLGIMVATLIMNVGNHGGLSLDAAARQIMADLEYAQSEAIRSQQSITVTFTPSSETYTLTDASGSVLKNPTTGQPYVVVLPDEADDDLINLTSANFGSSVQAVTFNALGEPMLGDGSGQMISNGYVIVIHHGTSRVRLRIAPMVGTVTAVSG